MGEKGIALIFIGIFCAGCGHKTAFLANYMKEQGLEGTVIIENLTGQKSYLYGKERSSAGFLPASTFKILNTLIALEEGIVKDEYETFRWDGVDRGYSAWNADQSMLTAFSSSCVWFYQELARRIGPSRYAEYLKQTAYGNQDNTGNIDSFWLDGNLRISAEQQITFLKNVYGKENGFSDKTYAILEKLMKVKQIGDGTLFAKTGWVTRVETQIGWYVGYLRTAKDVWFFAVDYNIRNKGDEKYRELIIDEAFRQIGIF